MTSQQIQKLTNRMLVFRACKQFMDSHQRQPAPVEIAEAVPSLSSYSVSRHMEALNGADGLEFPTWPPQRGGPSKRGFYGRQAGSDRTPVDMLMSGTMAANLAAREAMQAVSDD